MLKRRIIPFLPIRDGKIVKGVHFTGMRNPNDPIEAVAAYDTQGADEVFLCDESTTQEGHRRFIDVLTRLSTQSFLPITVAGDIRDENNVVAMIRAGADKVAINDAAISHPPIAEQWVKQFGASTIVAEITVKRIHPQPHDLNPMAEVIIHQGTRPTGLEAITWSLQLNRLGVGELYVRSIDRDGNKDGYDLWLIRSIAASVSIPVVAGGGVGTVEHIRQGLADDGGQANGALVGTFFHFGLNTIDQAKQYLDQHGIPVRLSNSNSA